MSMKEGEVEDVCPICLNNFHGQELGLPENCDHTFCLICIQEWAKTNNSCPVDRLEFHIIQAKNAVDGPIILRLPVEKAAELEAFVNDSDEEEDEATYCEVCGRRDREDRMLLCDGCDCGFHLECLTPPLDEVPLEEWFCPECAPQFQAEEVNRPRTRSGRRIIPRTEAAERVRIRVARRLEEESSSGEEEEEEVEEVVEKQAVVAPKKKPVARRKRRKRKIRRRRRRRGKKRRVAPEQASTSKDRLAKQLGIAPPSKGHFLPKVGGQNASSFWTSPGAPTTGVSLFGDPNAVYNFEDDDDDEDEEEMFSRNARNFNQRIVARSKGVQKSVKNENSVQPKAESSNPDLLGSIFQGQDALHVPSKNINIQRDGSLSESQHSKRKIREEKPRAGNKNSAEEETAIKAESLTSTNAETLTCTKAESCLPDSSDEVGSESLADCFELAEDAGLSQVVTSTVKDDTEGMPMDIEEEEDAPAPSAFNRTLIEPLVSKPMPNSPLPRQRKALLPPPVLPQSERKSLMGDAPPMMSGETQFLGNPLQEPPQNMPPPPIPPPGPAPNFFNESLSQVMAQLPASSQQQMIPGLGSSTMEFQGSQRSSKGPDFASQGMSFSPGLLLPPAVSSQGTAQQLLGAHFSAANLLQHPPNSMGALNPALLPQFPGLSFGQLMESLAPRSLPMNNNLSAMLGLNNQQQQLQGNPPGVLMTIEQALLGLQPQLLGGSQIPGLESLLLPQMPPQGGQPLLRGMVNQNPRPDMHNIPGLNLLEAIAAQPPPPQPRAPPPRPRLDPGDIPLPPPKRQSREAAELAKIRKIQEDEMSLRNSIFGKTENPRKQNTATPPAAEDPHLPPELASLVQHFSELKKMQGKEVPPPVEAPKPEANKRQKIRFSEQQASSSSKASRKLGRHERGKVAFCPPDPAEGSSNNKLSKAEKKQKKKEIKLKKLLAEATSTTGDDAVPASGIDEQKREKLLNKFNYQMRVEEEVKLALRPHYAKKAISKEEYKEIMKKTVPKICKKKGQIKPAKIQSFVEMYVQKIFKDRKLHKPQHQPSS